MPSTAYHACRAFVVAAAILTVLSVAACGGAPSSTGGSTSASASLRKATGATSASAPLEIRTVSNRADLVSGGDAVVEIVLPKVEFLTALRVFLNGRDVSREFARRADGRVLGLLTGLVDGENVVTATVGMASHGAQLVVTNHPIGGPVYSGPQITPYFCATTVPQPATATSPATNASGMSHEAIDAQCNIPTEFKLYYRTTAAGCSLSLPDPSPTVPYTSTNPPVSAPPPANPCFKAYDPGAPAPSDLARTTTDTGLNVPYVVRVERGTINRGIYDIAVLYDPSQPWTALAPQPQWNGKVLYLFGASTGQKRRQLRPAAAWTDDNSLGRGYMVVANSMTDSLQNSNRVMMSETVMMMKEHVSDTYGPIRFTMGSGCSGGSINSNMNASIYPGLLDGITISCAYPDSETTTMEVSDCVLLVEAYQKPQWLALMTAGGYTQTQINAKKAAINGHLDQTGCHAWYNYFGSNAKAGNYFQRSVPAANNATGVLVQSSTSVNNCELPASMVYDPVTNPTGARCNAWSWAESIWGKVPNTPFAQDTRDNVGVQYGLRALRSGAITGEEFVTLNEIVGGSDHDTNFTPSRSHADLPALGTAYRAGIVMSGAQLAKTAVIDMRGYDDSSITPVPAGYIATLGIHHIWRSFSIRDRLDRDGGGHGNQVMWRFGRYGLTPTPSMARDAFTTMDAWLTALKADTGTADLAVKVRTARPAAAFDYCVPSSDATQSTKVTDFAECDKDAFLVPHSSPRQVAGSPRTEDVLKCQLKPIDSSEYDGKLTEAQLGRLATVFPDGVCDWTKPGVGQQPAVSPLTFKDGPGGVPLGPPPSSTPLPPGLPGLASHP